MPRRDSSDGGLARRRSGSALGLIIIRASNALGSFRTTAYTWVTTKGIPGYTVGRFWRFKGDDADAWAREDRAASGSDDFDDRGTRNG